MTLDELLPETIAQHLQAPRTAVADLPQVALDNLQLIELRHGRPITLPISDDGDSPATSPEWAALTATGELAAILREKRAGQLWPHRNFLSAST